MTPIVVTTKNCKDAAGLSPAAFLRLVRGIPGAKKIGREWMVPATALLEWLASHDVPTGPEAPGDAALREIGYEEAG